MVVINPNNPTGTILSTESMDSIIKFAFENGLVIIADEVYQFNTHAEKKFISFKKQICASEAPYNQTALISINSISKGYTGECGVRGGYMEYHNISDDVMKQIYKMRDACSINVAGQIAMEVMCNPPDYTTASKETADKYAAEKQAICTMLATKAKLVVNTLNSIKGIKCQPIEGAMYALPRVFLTPSAISAAEKEGLSPDEFFCLKMLESTGIITVPGNGFGQAPGTYHFRMSLLVWELKAFERLMESMKKFMIQFFKDYP